MERTTISLAHYLVGKQIKFGTYVDTKVLVNNYSLIKYLTLSFFIYVFILLLIDNPFPLGLSALVIAVYTLIGFGVLFFCQLRKEVFKVQKDNFLKCSIKKININNLNFQGYVEGLENELKFKSLLRGESISGKVNFTAPNKSKRGANHKTLLTILDYVTVNGLKSTKKQELFSILNDNFLMAGLKLNEDSFGTLFYNWVNEKDEKKLQERKTIIEKVFFKG
ncbi:hypothetical protein M4I21_12040 [Cellulophaga sp. 20_2_10]|uniref:hypothetical protein n=1 Tax=Cellulophaga sp. 20_2_10 TaxID=2942476 RepID=UPI00201A6747|nr:hypothetical protein [Cellulophaga sp. 20_2_10]MCL5246546.1 hypothetical protein [Cellulophaga sp. 20_2_10]